jgi:hypothetical protein
MQAGRGGVSLAAQQAAVEGFDVETQRKRQRREEQRSAAISAAQHRRYESDASIRDRLSDKLKSLWDGEWGGVMRTIWQQEDLREKMKEIMGCDEMRERLRQAWRREGRLEWIRNIIHAMSSADVRERISARTRQAMSDEDVRARVAERTLAAMATEEVRNRHRDAMQDEELRSYLRRTLLVVWSSPEMQVRIQDQRLAACLASLDSYMRRGLQGCSICPIQSFDGNMVRVDPRCSAVYQRHLKDHPSFADGAEHFVCSGCMSLMKRGKSVVATHELFHVPPPPPVISTLSSMELHFVRRVHVFVEIFRARGGMLKTKGSSVIIPADRDLMEKLRQAGTGCFVEKSEGRRWYVRVRECEAAVQYLRQIGHPRYSVWNKCIGAHKPLAENVLLRIPVEMAEHGAGLGPVDVGDRVEAALDEYHLGEGDKDSEEEQQEAGPAVIQEAGPAVIPFPRNTSAPTSTFFSPHTVCAK